MNQTKNADSIRPAWTGILILMSSLFATASSSAAQGDVSSKFAWSVPPRGTTHVSSVLAL
jgi:hypothetical protein